MTFEGTVPDARYNTLICCIIIFAFVVDTDDKPPEAINEYDVLFILQVFP